MSLIDARCLTCGSIHEVVRKAADWPQTPPCPDCGEPTEQAHLPKRVQWTPDPVIVFQAADGSMRFPGDPNGLSAKNYERQGFRRIEIRGAAEMRRFESHMNKTEYSRAQRQVERKQQMRERRESETRSELRHRMQSMSERGRSMARLVMARNDNKPREKASESGFHSEVYAYNRSNRDDSRDAHGRRRRD